MPGNDWDTYCGQRPDPPFRSMGYACLGLSPTSQNSFSLDLASRDSRRMTARVSPSILRHSFCRQSLTETPSFAAVISLGFVVFREDRETRLRTKTSDIVIAWKAHDCFQTTTHRCLEGQVGLETRPTATLALQSSTSELTCDDRGSLPAEEYFSPSQLARSPLHLPDRAE